MGRDEAIRARLRKETTKATQKFALGGKEKTGRCKPKPVTLPRVSIQEK